MQLGISIDTPNPAKAGAEPGQALPAGQGNAAPATSGAAFGQLMAQALRRQGQNGNGSSKGTDPTQSPAAATAEAQALAAQQASLTTESDGKGSTGDSAQTKTDAQLDDTSPQLPAWLQPWLQALPVQQVSVGPTLQVITAQAPAPDASSLAAFAQQQGLSPEAIALLMNPKAGTQSTTPSTLAASSAPLSAMLPTPSSATLPTFTDTATAAASAAHAALSITPIPQPAMPWPGMQVNWTAHACATELAVCDPIAAANIAQGQLRGMQMNVAIGNGAVSRTGTPLSSTANFGSWFESTLNLGHAVAPDAVDTLAAETTQADSPTAHTDTAVRDFAGLARMADSPPQTPRDNSAGTTTNVAATHPGNDTDQMEQLADKMADAIGKRILSELERGHWNLRLTLKPAQLGHIEVEMRLRAGQLDATFAAPQAATRDLLQDGLSRLRDSLGQAGMDVANLHVKDGQNRQNGGDSTPGQRQFAQNAKSGSSVETVAPVAESTPRPRRTDGWDVMV